MIILGLKKFNHISEGLKSLGWPNVCDKLSLNDVASAKDPLEMTLTLTYQNVDWLQVSALLLSEAQRVLKPFLKT